MYAGEKTENEALNADAHSDEAKWQQQWQQQQEHQNPNQRAVGKKTDCLLLAVHRDSRHR